MTRHLIIENPPAIDLPGPDELRAAVSTCVERANASARPHFLALCREVGPVDPLQLFAHCGEQQRYFWEHPAQDYSLVALGSAWALDACHGVGERFAHAASAAREVFAATTVLGATLAVGDGFEADDLQRRQRIGPLLVGGFAFSARHLATGEWQRFPAAQLVLPRVLLLRQRGQCWLTVCQPIAPGHRVEDSLQALQDQRDRAGQLLANLKGPACGEVTPAAQGAGAEYRVVADRPHASYRQQVADALEAIAVQRFEKVVLARSLLVEHPGRFAVPDFLDRLRGLYPGCVSFACARGDDTFVAATPERLVSLAGDRLITGALAGSAARGQTPEQDAWLAAQLQASTKEHAEHRAVVGAIRAALGDICEPLQGPQQPQLLRLAGIQHLFTPLQGRLQRRAATSAVPALPASVIDIVRRLHPTPAVGGLPAAEALRWIEREEGLERGWFGGPVGFIDRHGGGEFWVALRSALVRNGPAAPASARLFAGAGIVCGSTPEQELRETRLKLRALLAPLTEI